MLNTGINHDHMDRIISSKQSTSENLASMYFMFKDHKSEGGFRPVVSGCNSDSLGLSNTLSEVVESVCMATQNPYEVISSEDLLSRIHETNKKISKITREKNEKLMEKNRDQNEENDILESFREFWFQLENTENKWRWTDEYIVLGTDVCSLFPSLSAEKTSKAVRNQFVKSKN